MKQVVFFVILTLSSIGRTQPEVYLEIPDVVFSDIPTKSQILPSSDTIPPFFLQLTHGSIDTLWVQEDNNGKFVEPVYRSGESLTFVHFKLKSKRPSVIPLWLSILPPLLAIFLALIFKEVVFSLVSGIFVGAAILGVYTEGFVGIFTGFLAIIDTYVLNALTDSDHLAIIVFSILIGGVVALISKNGGMRGIVNSISRYAKTARSGQLTTWALGIAIFFDDYANTLVVGNTMRPVTDKLKISREKLSYIVDATAAPVAAVAFVTTWIGAEMAYINSGITEINADGVQISEGVYSIFLNSLAFAFYPFLTIFFMFWLIWREKDFGPMLTSEKRARNGQVVNPEENMGDLTEFKDIEPGVGTIPHAYNAVVPVAVIVFGTFVGLIYTGFENLGPAILVVNPELHIKSWWDVWDNISVLDGNPNSAGQKIGTIIGASNSYAALLWASLSSLLTAIVLSMSSRSLNLKTCVETAMIGFKTMIPALMILILAWSLAEVTIDMHTATFITNAIDGTVPPWMMPILTFILSGFVAFSTGSSWSTMALMYPLVLPATWMICMDPAVGLSHPEAMAIFYNTVSCVLAGAVLGDHCSPISDTTILSSLASGCNHLDHVKTQMPYALTVAAVGLILGTLPSAIGFNPWLCLGFGAIGCIVVIEILGKKSRKRKFDESDSGD